MTTSLQQRSSPKLTRLISSDFTFARPPLRCQGSKRRLFFPWQPLHCMAAHLVVSHAITSVAFQPPADLAWSPRTVRAALRQDGHQRVSLSPAEQCQDGRAHVQRGEWRRKCATPSCRNLRRRRWPSRRRATILFLHHDSAVETPADKVGLDLTWTEFREL